MLLAVRCSSVSAEHKSCSLELIANLRLACHLFRINMINVVIFQYRLLHYRVRLFELMREMLAAHGINLVLACGQPSATEKSRKDEGHLDWACMVTNRYWRIGGKDIAWQPMPSSVRNAALCVVMQENRLLYNYVLQLRRNFGGPLVAFWGHGRNYQASDVSSFRERWKNIFLRRVDWWFAYTSSVAKYISGKGFDVSRVTVLDNAIDVSGFIGDLHDVTEAEVRSNREKMGIAENAQVTIYCGSIYAEKRIGVLLESADLLRARLPDFHLLIVGDGPDAGMVRAAAASRPWIHVRGIRQGRDKAVDYRLASVMLNPGAVGLHVVDSFAARVPIVTQKSAMHGPEYDYLVNGVNGRSVDDDSAGAYADAVAQMYLQPGLLHSMQEQCALSAPQYTVENMAENFSNGIIECLLRNGRILNGRSETNAC